MGSETIRSCVNPQLIQSYLANTITTIFLSKSALFSRLMETMKPWFQYGKLESGNSRLKKPVHAAPFAMSEDDLLPSTPLAIKIQRIYDVILKKNDVELYTHLSRLDIPPQVYGL